MPDGKGIVISHATLAHPANFQLSFLSYPSGARVPITNDLTSYDPSGLDVTADGKTLATVQEESSLGVWVMPAEGNATPKAINSAWPRISGLMSIGLPTVVSLPTPDSTTSCNPSAAELGLPFTPAAFLASTQPSAATT